MTVLLAELNRRVRPQPAALLVLCGAVLDVLVVAATVLVARRSEVLAVLVVAVAFLVAPRGTVFVVLFPVSALVPVRLLGASVRRVVCAVLATVPILLLVTPALARTPFWPASRVVPHGRGAVTLP